MADMLRYFRLKKPPDEAGPSPGTLTGEWLSEYLELPITVAQLNCLPENTKRRVYRALLPPDLLVRFNVNPLTWRGPDGNERVILKAEAGTGVVSLSVRTSDNPDQEFIFLEMSDNCLSGVCLNFLLLGDPRSPRYNIDRTEDGRSTLFGTVHRNLAAEVQAMRAGLAPAQVHQSLGASRLMLGQLEIFLTTCGHTAFFLEPLTYVSAWVFERYGFAYVRGHKLMEDIDREFRPDGRLHAALDGCSPFRQPEQWHTVRGRAWAIHDGILQAIEAAWDGVRMVKQIGRHAGVETYPNAVY